MKKILEIRKDIDRIDNELVNSLLKRKKLIEKIRAHRKKNKMDLRDKNREKEVILKIKNKAKNKSEENYLVETFNTIIKSSRSKQ